MLSLKSIYQGKIASGVLVLIQLLSAGCSGSPVQPAAEAIYAAEATVITPYPDLPGLPIAADYQLTQGNRIIPIYEVPAGRFAMVRSTGSETFILRRTDAAPIKSATLRPSSPVESHHLKNGAVSLRLSGLGAKALELDGDQSRPLFLINHPPELPPDRALFTHFFDSGKVHELPEGKLKLRDGESVYIAGGAVVRGCIEVQGKKGAPIQDIRIAGQGVLDAGAQGKPLCLINTRDSLVEGITLLNTGGWTFRLFEVQNVKVNSVNILATGEFSDGIDVLGSSDVVVSGGFIHSQDDCIAIKGSKWGFRGNVERVTLENLVIWKASAGNGIEIGYETDVDYIRDITVKNIAILHVGRKEFPFRRAALSIHNSGHAAISNVLYEDITIEQASENLIYLWVGKSGFIERKAPGTIKNVTYRRVRYINGSEVPSVINCSEATGSITGITFDRCLFLDRPIKEPANFDLTVLGSAPPAFR